MPRTILRLRDSTSVTSRSCAQVRASAGVHLTHDLLHAPLIREFALLDLGLKLCLELDVLRNTDTIGAASASGEFMRARLQYYL